MLLSYVIYNTENLFTLYNVNYKIPLSVMYIASHAFQQYHSKVRSHRALIDELVILYSRQ